MPVAAVAALGVGASLYSSNKAAKAQSSAANQASAAQQASSEAAIEEQRRQFDEIQKLLAPYVNAGTSSLTGQQDLLGLNGNAAQQAAIQNIANSSQMKAMTQQGENAILQNAAATGGLRGGNTQAALGQFRPQLLNQLIGQQYTNLGGLTSLGQNAASGVGNAGMASSNNISSLLGSIGDSQAGAALMKGQANSQGWSALSNIAGGLTGAYLGKQF